MWKCNICGETILSKMSSRTICHKCHYENYGIKQKEYMKDYMSTKRWLNGGPDNRLIGEKIDSICINTNNGVRKQK